MSGIYVTNTGFVKKTLADIKTELETAYKEQFGQDIDLDPDGPFGLIIGITSKMLADNWDALEEIYTSRDPQQATGSSLDYICSENNIIRQDAQPTTVLNVRLYGDEGTIIPIGSQIRQQNNLLITYGLDAEVTITENACREIRFSVDDPVDTAGLVYSVTIDGTLYEYTTLITDEINDVIDGLIVLITAGTWNGTATRVNSQLVLIDTTDDFGVVYTANLTVELIGAGGNFTCNTDGYISAPANTLTKINTPVSGWDSVNNPADGVIGRDEETDAELRIRRASITSSGYATDESIRTNLIQNVDNVTQATVISNRSNVEDGDGRPAKSFECIVFGGVDQDIANEIWRVQPAGISSFGNITESVTDSQGTVQSVSFSRPVSRYIHVRVSRSLYSEETYPDDGDTAIKNAIIAWSDLSSNITIGKDVIRQRLSTPIYTVEGIEDIKIELAVTTNPGDSPTFAEANIAIGVREVADFDITRITVQDLV